MFNSKTFTILGVGYLVSRELERKLQQRREDAVTFSETPVALAGGIFAAMLVAGYARALRGQPGPELNLNRRE